MQIDIFDDQRRHRHLVRTVKNRGCQRLILLQPKVSVRVLDLHGCVIDQHADRQRQTAQRHNIDRLASAEETAIANKTASGIDTLTISVLRQLPRNTRTIRAVRKAAVTASCTTSWIEARTSTD